MIEGWKPQTKPLWSENSRSELPWAEAVAIRGRGARGLCLPAVPGDGLHIVWPEVIGEIRGRYFLLSGQKLSAAEAKEFGAVNEVVSREALLPRAWELARHMKKQDPLTLRYTRMALSTRFRRRLQEACRSETSAACRCGESSD